MAKEKQSDKKPSKELAAKKEERSDKTTTKVKAKPIGRVAGPIGGGVKSFFGYFKGAWHELRMVRWPNRRASLSLTGALLVFTAFFIVLILLVDAFFEYIFKLLIK